jgi:hypothetical protein
MGQHTSMSGFRFKVAGLALIVGSLTVATGFLAAHWLRSEEESALPSSPAVPSSQPPAALFRDWPANRKPDLVLVLTGQEHGYLQPCGCSRPQLGGLARRWNFIEQLRKERGWPVVAVDLGDIVDDPRTRRAIKEQVVLKYQTSMEALKQMGYLGVAIGQYETEMPLLDILLDKEQGFVNCVKSWTVGGGKGMPKVGVVGIVGPSVAEHVPNQNPAAKFAKTVDTLPDVFKEMKPEKPDLLVMLYQGSIDEARACARMFPQFSVILCLTKEEEPSDKPERIGNTLVIGVGHKGRYVGVVGAWRAGRPGQLFDLRYQLAKLDEEYETAKGKEDSNPIMVLMERYAQEVKRNDFLTKYPVRKHPLQVDFSEATYVGSQKCAKCHEKSFEIWKKTPHAHAYHELETAAHPGLRQYDGECVACHVVGFGYQGGFKDEVSTPRLKDVGCESCHGPASMHVSNPNNRKVRALMNPFRPQENETPEATTKRLNLIDQACQKCHDTDNDVHWDFKKKWPSISHVEDIAPRPK